MAELMLCKLETRVRFLQGAPIQIMDTTTEILQGLTAIANKLADASREQSEAIKLNSLSIGSLAHSIEALKKRIEKIEKGDIPLTRETKKDSRDSFKDYGGHYGHD